MASTNRSWDPSSSTIIITIMIMILIVLIIPSIPYLISPETDSKPAGDREREPGWKRCNGRCSHWSWWWYWGDGGGEYKWQPSRHRHCSGGAGREIEIFLGKSVKFRTVKKNSKIWIVSENQKFTSSTATEDAQADVIVDAEAIENENGCVHYCNVM